LPLEAAGDEVTVAIPDDAVVWGDGQYRAKVWRAIRDLDDVAVLLRPENAPNTQFLRAVLPKAMTVGTGDEVCFTLSAEKCLCYGAER
ncbi:MAG: hypothetical protein ACI4O3_05115, partial [Oscillospiraceae bacterium]